MTPFEEGIAGHIGTDALEKIRSVNVGIAGAGGLGSNCAAHLVRCGFRKFVIADYDRVEMSNLNRQFFFHDQVEAFKVSALKGNLEAINPDIEAIVCDQKIETGNVRDIFDECDVIIEAFDNTACKKLIVETYMNSDKLLVAASGIAGYGNTDDIRTRRIRNNFFIVGDMVSEADDTLPPMSPGVAVAAAKQADVVLSYYLDGYEKIQGTEKV